MQSLHERPPLNAAALAEKIFGVGKNIQSYLYINIGTGIGGGIILDGKIFHGRHYLAGEIGHMKLAQSGPKCTCGKFGCLEAYASGPAIVRRAKEYEGITESLLFKLTSADTEGITAEKIYEAGMMGDPIAINIIEETGDYIGIAIANALKIIDVYMVIIGGGVSKAGKFLFGSIQAKVRKESFNQVIKEIEIIPSILGDDVGDLGAVAIVLDAIQNK